MTNLLRRVGLVPHEMREQLSLLEEIVKPLGRGRHARGLRDSRGAGSTRVGGVGVLSLHDKLYLDLKLITEMRFFDFTWPVFHSHDRSTQNI